MKNTEIIERAAINIAEDIAKATANGTISFKPTFNTNPRFSRTAKGHDRSGNEIDLISIYAFAVANGAWAELVPDAVQLEADGETVVKNGGRSQRATDNAIIVYADYGQGEGRGTWQIAKIKAPEEVSDEAKFQDKVTKTVLKGFRGKPHILPEEA